MGDTATRAPVSMPVGVSMNEAEFKQLAQRLHTYLVPRLGVAFKLSHAQEVLTALVGAKTWHDLKARPALLDEAQVTIETVNRICDRIRHSYGVTVDPRPLLNELTGRFVSHPYRAQPAEIPHAWVCDACQQVIHSAIDGYVIWKRSGRKQYGFKIIHHVTCDLPDHQFSLALTDVLGQDGLLILTSLLSAGPVHAREGEATSIYDIDPHEWVDFFRRVHIPYYDLARYRLTHPRVKYDFADHNEWTPYRPDALKRILEAPEYED